MRIVILGAGTIGTWIADLLCRNRHDVTVVDADPSHARRVNEELDVRALTGSASESSVLFQADVIGSDLCLAVTGQDEVNLVAASMAKAMGARRTIARVYGAVFHDMSTFDYQRHFRVDRLLSLEQLSAMQLARGIRSPGSLAVENFANGELEVQELTVDAKAAAIGVSLKKLGLPRAIRIGSILREGRMWIAGADDTLQLGDRVTIIGRREDIDEMKVQFQAKPPPKRNIVIAGAGETGFHLARTLANRRFSVLVMESDEQRCQDMANRLKHATVVQADATRRVTLEEERVGKADVFAACTGDDENNIMACVEAREVGARTIMAVVGRPDYANVVGKLGIDLAVSPRDVMAKQVLGFLNKGPVISRTSLPGGNIAVLELEVLDEVIATEHVLANLPLPSQCLIAGVMREDFVSVPGADDRLRAGDTVVALIEDSVVEEMLPLFSNNGR